MAAKKKSPSDMSTDELFNERRRMHDKNTIGLGRFTKQDEAYSRAIGNERIRREDSEERGKTKGGLSRGSMGRPKPKKSLKSWLGGLAR